METAPATVTITAPHGGVMTREVGAITGALELTTQEQGMVGVRYVGATDTYTVTGNPPPNTTLETIATILSTDPGTDQWDNPLPATLPTT